MARRDAGEPVTREAVGSLLAETERALDRPGGDEMADLEQLRRWYLVLLAEQGAGELEEIVALIELLRDDRPDLRSGTTNPDPVVARLCRPFTVLGARLAALQDTTLLVLEPSVAAGARTARAHDLGRSWQLSKGPAALFDALQDFSATAARERERLNTRELPLRSPASAELRAGRRARVGEPAVRRRATPCSPRGP